MSNIIRKTKTNEVVLQFDANVKLNQRQRDYLHDSNIRKDKWTPNKYFVKTDLDLVSYMDAVTVGFRVIRKLGMTDTEFAETLTALIESISLKYGAEMDGVRKAMLARLYR